MDISKEHGGSGSHSGVSTPFNKSGTQTPRTDDGTTIAPSPLGSSTAEHVEILSEKLSRRKSFGTAALAVTPGIRASSSGLSQEHIEQGRVKRTVYLRYLEAASKVGFSAFLVATLLQQVVSVFANIILRNLGEHNRESGDNSGMFYYLLGYGLFSLASIIFSGLAAILLWVLCTVKSARYLHDSVSMIGFYLGTPYTKPHIQMLNSVMRAPLSFFELTPTGRCVLSYALLGRKIIELSQHPEPLFTRYVCSHASIACTFDSYLAHISDSYVVDQLLVRVSCSSMSACRQVLTPRGLIIRSYKVSFAQPQCVFPLWS
jgi:hypothetical protein